MRGQLTVFIIIGMLIVIAFGIALYVGGRMKERIEATPSEISVEQMGIRPVYDYVTTCLNLAANEALELMGKQGGVLYKSQGGVTAESSDYVNYADVKYAEELHIHPTVVPPTGTVCQDIADISTCSFFSEPPDYPFATFPYAGGQELFFGYYGESRLPPLYRGENPETGEPVQGSIQETLEKFIAVRTADCADFASFKDRFSFTTGNPEAKLIFATQAEQFVGEQNVNIELQWPIEVTNAAGDKTVMENFAIRLPVRLATTYYTVKSIIDSDVTDSSFVPGDTGSFTVQTIPLGEDSIVFVKDGESAVGGRPFEFWIARKNRIPALWQIDVTPLQTVQFHVTSEGTGARVTIVPIDEETAQLEITDPCQDTDTPNPYIIKLKATDPDENPVTFDVHVPGGKGNEIQTNALGFQYAITVFAKDGSASKTWDSQEIPLTIGMCAT